MNSNTALSNVLQNLLKAELNIRRAQAARERAFTLLLIHLNHDRLKDDSVVLEQLHLAVTRLPK
jgi:hypothetical protein